MMAKSQRRGNKEAKKPKKVRAPEAAPMTLSRGLTVAAVPKKKQ